MIELGYLRKRAYEGLNYRLRTVGWGRLSSWCRPTSICMLLTEQCTARCLHCDIWKNTAREENPDVAQWRKLLADLREWLGPVQVVVTGGEALMKPYAIDLVAEGHRLGLFMEILTHGFWTDQKKIERLALAEPWRVTISLDGLGSDHDRVRGRAGFFEKTAATIATLKRVREERNLSFTIRLKFVLMSHNLHAAADVARFAAQPGMDVFYQPVEQNYNTPEDLEWFRKSANWPSEPEAAVRTVEQLIALKRAGFPVANSDSQLNVMIPYFRDPSALSVRTRSHSAHEQRALCNALTMIEVRSNGDVAICNGLPPVGNIKTEGIRRIWEERPRAWEEGCCLTRRCSAADASGLALPVIP
jgi:MoaA/NifB/PqqE/SkfB family radical SAM enzyme